MQIPSSHVIYHTLTPVSLSAPLITMKSKVKPTSNFPALFHDVILLTNDTFSCVFSLLTLNILIVCEVNGDILLSQQVWSFLERKVCEVIKTLVLLPCTLLYCLCSVCVTKRARSHYKLLTRKPRYFAISLCVTG